MRNSLKDFRARALARADVRREYDALADTWTPTPRGSYIPGEGSGGSRDMISPSLDKIKASQKVLAS